MVLCMCKCIKMINTLYILNIIHILEKVKITILLQFLKKAKL